MVQRIFVRLVTVMAPVVTVEKTVKFAQKVKVSVVVKQ